MGRHVYLQLRFDWELGFREPGSDLSPFEGSGLEGIEPDGFEYFFWNSMG
jgi:hypothetical protein